MELKEGMYAYAIGKCRDYGIGKIRKIESNGFDEKQVEIVFKNSTHSVGYSSVVASFNKIDLIQIGDYVNGYKVVKTDNSIDGHKYITTEAYYKINYGNIFESEIESIVTKEQFNSMAYKV